MNFPYPTRKGELMQYAVPSMDPKSLFNQKLRRGINQSGVRLQQFCSNSPRSISLKCFLSVGRDSLLLCGMGNPQNEKVRSRSRARKTQAPLLPHKIEHIFPTRMMCSLSRAFFPKWKNTHTFLVFQRCALVFDFVWRVRLYHDGYGIAMFFEIIRCSF